MAGEKRRARLRALLKTAGAAEVDTAAVEQAFVHESAAREGAGRSNERLEFLGDAILGYVAARWLTAKYADATEGELARRKAALVSGEACAKTARRLGFGELVVLGLGMAQSGGSENATILADAFEAFIAVLAAATDVERVARFVEREHLVPADKGSTGEPDAKTALQEFAQAALRVTPMYFERAEGAPHERRYTSQVRVGDEILGEGIGPSKKAAQLSAAAMALTTLRHRHPASPARPASNHDDGRVIALDKRRRPRSPRKPDPGAPV
ncbi:MAG: ribonuclease III [Candidatus Eremiobacteraeota bacterium]|nr:ribonuclease III [Candidatus Eremiobacteraeota bacterium]